MMYHHTARFQIVLRDALRLQSVAAIQVPGKEPLPYSDEAMLSILNYKKGRTTLTKFRNARLPSFDDPKIIHMTAAEIPGGLRDVKLARDLWDHLSQRGYIRLAIIGGEGQNVKRKELYSERQVANTLSSFFEVKDRHVKRLSESGLVDKKNNEYAEGEWICYKNSWRQAGFIVKSLFTVSNEYNEYFRVFDEQRATGRFSVVGQPVSELSTGIAISKSDKIWCFLRESNQDQPRIFCFFRPMSSNKEVNTMKEGVAGQKLAVLYGHVMETERMVRGEFYSSYVVLISKELDRKEWLLATKKTSGYVLQDQIDVFPKPNIDGFVDRSPEKKYSIPEFVLSYINDGIIRT